MRNQAVIVFMALGASLGGCAEEGRTQGRAGTGHESGGEMTDKDLAVYSVQEAAFVDSERVERSDEEWRRRLAPEAFRVTREHGTEIAFSGEYWNHKGEGVYRCVGCGNDLFTSDAKFESGTGWPSFWKAVHEANLGSRRDRSWFMKRTEVHCVRCGAHLGHVFPDGPKPTGLRYCVNSAALRFEATETRDEASQED